MPKPATISIVDDDGWARDGIRVLVESLGYEAFAFVSAEQFLESDVLNTTACVITDLQMPGLSGLDLQRELGSKGYRIPIIFITAFPDDRRREHALGAGAIGFLTKPFDERSLIDCLSAAVGGRP
ncbi:MAG: response regulator [Xanthobacteraceae bacterium]